VRFLVLEVARPCPLRRGYLTSGNDPPAFPSFFWVAGGWVFFLGVGWDSKTPSMLCGRLFFSTNFPLRNFSD